MNISPDFGFAVLFGVLFILLVWKWFRPRSGSTDRRSLPIFIALMASLLMQLLPRLLWPTIGSTHLVGSVAGIGLVSWAAFVSIRKSRRGDPGRAATRSPAQ